MHHGLLVASLIIAELGHLLQCLANSGDIAVAKDTKASGENSPFSPDALVSLATAISRELARHCSKCPSSAIIRLATSRPWCMPLPPTQRRKTAYRHWPAPRQLA